MVGLRPRIVIYFSVPVRRKLRLLPRLCHPVLRYIVTGRAYKYPRPDRTRFATTCVQRLIDAELPLKTIGDYVGHRSPESTRVYSKVAIASLREVAMGDGEEL